MKNLIAFSFLLTFLLGGLKAQDSSKIFTEGPNLIFDQGQKIFLEGPTCSPEGIIYFSNLTAFSMKPGDKTGLIWKYDLEKNSASVLRSPSGQANGMMLDKQGRLVVCEGAVFGGRRVTRTNLETGISELLVGLFDNKPLNSPNDVVIDEKDRIYFTDPKFAGHELAEQPVHGVYRIDTNLVTTRIISDIHKPNGIILSPDQKTLYVATSDTINNALLAYELHEDGSAIFKSRVVEWGKSIGDGMTVDMEGNIYVAHPIENILRIYNTEGEKLDEVKFPTRPATNVVFGRGKYSNTLFVTAGRCLYSVETSEKGYNLPIENE
jgi:gluconolactonase